MKVNVASVVYIACLLVHVQGSPTPQEDSQGSLRTTTEKCDEFQFNSYIEGQVQCYTNAGQVVDEALNAGSSVAQIKRAICQSISGQVDCIEENADTCFTEEEANNVKFYFLSKEFERTFNDSKLFGDDFIQSCPVLREHEDELVQYLTESTVCSYSEFQSSFVEFKSCKDRAVAKKDTRIDLLDWVQSDKIGFFTRTWCDLKKEYDACIDQYKKCLSQNFRNILKKNNDELFQSIQTSLRENSLPDFNYVSSCPDSVVRLGGFGSPTEIPFGISS